MIHTQGHFSAEGSSVPLLICLSSCPSLVPLHPYASEAHGKNLPHPSPAQPENLGLAGHSLLFATANTQPRVWVHHRPSVSGPHEAWFVAHSLLLPDFTRL